MKPIVVLVLVVALLPLCTMAQRKGKLPPFCGWKLNDTAFIRREYQAQIDFLSISSGDTIVDIGAQSGTYEGLISTVGSFTNVHFLLVDIDSACLNAEKVGNMRRYYEEIKGSAITNHFQWIINSPDSLFLPHNQYGKVWLLNTLHEIPDPSAMIGAIYRIMKPGGELVLLEQLATPKHHKHGGCNKPLFEEKQLEELLSAQGFTLDGVGWDLTSRKDPKRPLVMFRYRKKA